MADTLAYLLFLLIITLLEFFGFLTKGFLEILLRRETTTSWITPWPTCSSFSSSFYYFFWFPNKSLFGILFEEGDNYVLANTSAYLLFLLIIILSFFAFLTEVFLEFFLRWETTTSWLKPRPTCSSFSSSFYFFYFGFLTKVFLEFFLRWETTTSWLTPRPTCSSFSSSFYQFFLFPKKILFRYIFKEGDYLVSANTLAT